jgi:hypothetical protein
MWHTHNQKRIPLLEGLIETPESLVHSTRPRIHHRNIKRRDATFLRRLLPLGQDFEGISPAPSRPVYQA